MARERHPRPPIVCRALVRLATFVAPATARAEWRAKWDSNLWNWWILFERGELTARDQARLIAYIWGSLMDAFWLRFSRAHLRHTARGAGAVLAAGAVALALMAAATHGFRGTRALFDPLPLENPDALVSIRYTGAANEPFGVPPRVIPVWREKSKLLVDLAGYLRPARNPRAWVTTNFFSVMGVNPALGRTFRPGDADVAILSGGAWITMFNRDPKVVGRKVDLGGRDYTIVGVLPEAFWAISPSVDVWTPLDVDPLSPTTPYLIGIVGRLRPGADLAKVRTELFDIARNANQFLPRPPQVVAFGSVPSHPFVPYLFGLAFALICGAALVSRGLPRPSGRGWFYWTYLAAKTGFAILIPTLLWVELSQRAGVVTSVMTVRVLLAGILLPITYLLATACALRWIFADQRLRCPVCMQLLSMPVTLGSWGSILDPASTEMLCDSGHGTLQVPDAADGQPDRWTNLDPSWAELFRDRE